MGTGWQRIARFILKQRIPILLAVALMTGFMWHNRVREQVHSLVKVVPDDDPDLLEYQAFKRNFGEDANVLILGFEGDFFEREYFNELYSLSEKLREVDGITGVASITHLQDLRVDTSSQSFVMEAITPKPVETDEEMEAVEKRIRGLEFYRGLVFNDSMTVTVVAATVRGELMETPEKDRVIADVKAIASETSEKLDTEIHYGGLPFVLNFIKQNLPGEMAKFLILAVLVLAITLYIFFRSFFAVIFPMVVVGIVVIWTIGFMGLMDYKINVLSAVLPSLITVIAIPNCIYLVTKYHFEFKKSRNQMKSLVLVIQKIGIVTVMTNATTAVGFLVLGFTRIRVLSEFGLAAGVAVLITFFISLLLIPIIFSFLPPPNTKQIKHTDNRSLSWVIKFIDNAVHNRRTVIYIITLIMAVGAFFGAARIQSLAHMVDDIPQSDKIIQDLHFMEDHFGGVMPFEIAVNTHRKGGVFKHRTLSAINEFQEGMKRFPEISRSVSMVDVVKFGRQGLMGGQPDQYQFPIREELQAMMTMGRPGDSLTRGSNMFDSLYTIARIKANVRDVGSIRMAVLVDSLSRDLEELFVRNTKSGRLDSGAVYQVYGTDSFRIKYGDSEYTGGEIFTADRGAEYEILAGDGKIDYADRVKITGTTKIFIKSNQFLIRNLIQSLLLAFLIIAFMMALLFGSFRMVLISLLPNFLPLLITAGVMGWTNVPLKPSTALIFSVAFGIAVDDTIHYLARYRLARKTGDSIKVGISNSFKDTGVSMIYTSIVLFFGFVIFAFSWFGGTQALGKLTSLTLLVALFSNLLLLPSLLITLHRNSDDLDPEGILDYEEEKEDVEMIREFLSPSENGNDLKDTESPEIP